MWTTPSSKVSLDRMSRPRKIVDVRSFVERFQPDKYNVIHRYEETICGRAYHIEVTAVSNRWRAQLRRMPGMPTAMMPFYGQTPDEAALQLTKWLTLTHRRLVPANSSS
jgi:hypothetical protein